ncbi:MAG: lipopolysaccharide heptosyltransferase II [candidate division KSB1 bacterium]|nr:lipopolysaccharide heptosyltransferase II [candidate division KSB1 bacterium]
MKRLMASDPPAKILIIRLSSIGDVILATPVIRVLKKKFPHSRIDFVIKKQLAELVAFHPGINRCYVFDRQQNWRSLREIKQDIKRTQYDLIVDLHKNIRSYFLTIGSRCHKIVRYRKDAITRFLYVKLRLVQFNKNKMPLHQRYLKALAPYHVQDDGEGLEIFWDHQKTHPIVEKLAPVLDKDQSVIVGIAPGASFATKRWLPEGFAEVIRYLRQHRTARIMLFGNQQDHEIASELVQLDRKAIVDTTGQCSLLETAALMQCCDLILTNDSGLMHLAAALKKKVVAIFGSTTEELGFFPYTTEHIVVQNRYLSCRPCSHVGRNRCPQKHFKCMKEITPEQVIEAVETMLDSSHAIARPATDE